MSRDVGDIFLTSLDKVYDFIYRVYGVPEEFRAKTEKGEVPEGGRIAPMDAPTTWGLPGGPQGHTQCALYSPGIFHV